MSNDKVITNANDVELVIKGNNTKRGTAKSMGRVVVDDFSITRDEDDSLESGVGHRLPSGISNGDIEHGFSFTIMGQDVDTFEMVATQDGRSNIFSFTAKNRDDDVIEWEYALDTCKVTSEEVSGSSGDTLEYSIEGIAVSLDKKGVRGDGQDAWNEQ